MRSLGRFAVVVSLALGTACLPPAGAAQPTTTVGRGELYRTGKVAYDEMFSTVHELQVDMAGVPDDRRAARSGLAQALGLLPTSPPERVVEALRDRVAELKRAGAFLATTTTTAAAEGKPSPDARVVAQGLGSCLSGEHQIAERMRKIPERAEAMLALHKTLASSVENEFPLVRQGEVKRELQAAGAALGQMKEEAPRLGSASDKYVDELRAASGAPAASATPPPPKPKKPASTGATPPPPPQGTSAPPFPPPPKPPADDFNP